MIINSCKMLFKTCVNTMLKNHTVIQHLRLSLLKKYRYRSLTARQNLLIIIKHKYICTNTLNFLLRGEGNFVIACITCTNYNKVMIIIPNHIVLFRYLFRNSLEKHYWL